MRFCLFLCEKEKEGLLKYFVLQSFMSILLLFFMNFPKGNCFIGFWLPTVALLIKLGSFPFHCWFINVVKRLSWMGGVVLFTWQKLAPSYVLIYQSKKFLGSFAWLSSFFGALCILNKKNLKEFLGYSSVFNLGWIIICSCVGVKVMFYFYFFYWLRVVGFVLCFCRMCEGVLSESGNGWKRMGLFRLINLAGLPPFLIFLVKWYLIFCFVEIGLIFLSFFYLFVGVLRIYSYFRSFLFSFFLSSQVGLKVEDKMSLLMLVFSLILTWVSFLIFSW